MSLLYSKHVQLLLKINQRIRFSPLEAEFSMEFSIFASNIKKFNNG